MPGLEIRPVRPRRALVALSVWLAVVPPAVGAAAGPDRAAGPGARSREEAADRLTPREAGREFLRDAGRIWSAPARLRAKDVAPLFVLGAVTGVLIATDGSSRDAVHSWSGRYPWVGDVAPVVTEIGGLGGFAAAGALFGAGLLFKDARVRDTGYLAASAVLQTFLVDAVLKGVSGRQRPSAADGLDHWAGPGAFFKRFESGRSDFYESFPSGHTASAFALATVVSLRSRSPWVGIAAYGAAAAVGLSRMALDKHWLSDVVAGAVVGHLVARLVVRGHDRRPRLVPTLACGGRGVALGFSYDLDRRDP